MNRHIESLLKVASSITFVTVQ